MKKTTKWQKLLAVMIAAGMMVSALAANTVMAADEADDPTLGGGIITPDSTETVPDEVDDSLGQNPPDDEGTTTDVITEGGEQTGNEEVQTGGGQTGEGGEEEPETGEPETANVAQIGETEYGTLDAAIADAADGATIELLADATTDGMNLSKDLTIQGAKGLAEKPTITFVDKGIALWGIALTFKDCDVEMNGIGATPYGEWTWMTICASTNASLTLDNVDMLMDAEGTTNSPHAIYFCTNNVLNIQNGSTLTIQNYANDALEWDGGNGGYNVNITDSIFVSDHNRSGFTGTFYATITNSQVDVINSTGNGSNGSHFIIKDSQVNFNDNGSHGLSAGELSIDHSTVSTLNNKGMGITVNNAFTVKNESVVTVSGNAENSSYGYAAVRLYNDFEFTVDSSSELYITNNNNTGLYVRQGNLNVEDGAVLEITGNKVSHNLLDGYGGGVYVGYGDNYDPTVTLPADAQIYNNHALTGGDDIYVSEGVNGPTLTFGATGQGWRLDGEPDCTHLIDGWYDDSEGARWEAHAETAEGNHVEEFTEFGENGLATVTGLKALKAAHGLVPPEEPEEPSDPEPENPPYIPDPDPSEPEEPSEPSDPGEEISDPETPQTSFPSTDPSVPDAVPGEPSGEPSETPAETIPDEETPQTAQPPQTGVKVAGSLLLVACASAVAAATLRKKKK